MTPLAERIQMPFLAVCLVGSLGDKPEREGQGSLPVGDSVGHVWWPVPSDELRSPVGGWVSRAVDRVSQPQYDSEGIFCH